MKIRLLLSSWLVCASVVVNAANTGAQQADQSSDTLRVDLNAALKIALSDNPTIKIADKEIERVDYSKKAAWYGLLPSLSGTGQYTRNIKRQTVSMGGMSIQMGQDNAVALGLSASLPLIAPALWYSIQMTGLDMQLASEKARASKVTLRNDVIKAYFGILLAQDSYSALQAGYDIAHQNYEEAKKRFEVGMTAEYDYISAEVQMRNLLPTLLQVKNGIVQAKMYLKVLLGVRMEVAIETEGSLKDYEESVVEQKTASSVSFGNNTDLMQLDIQQKQLAKALQLQRSQHLPTLAAFGNFQYQGMGNDKEEAAAINPLAPPTPAGMMWPDPSVAVGVQLNIPIFSGFSNTIKAKQLKIQAKELELQRDYVVSSLDLQARTALDNMNKAVEQMESNKKGVELAEKSYKISEDRYTTGMGTILELHSSALALTQSRLAHSQSISDYLSAKADYEKIVGIQQ